MPLRIGKILLYLLLIFNTYLNNFCLERKCLEGTEGYKETILLVCKVILSDTYCTYKNDSYRVTHQVVLQVLLTSKQMLRFSIRRIY